MKKVFIDGSAGTTGLRIYERLSARNDILLLSIPEAERKNPEKRRELLNAADIVFLCLPDDAAREAVGMVENSNTTVIDTSTAHRTEAGWAYGFPELSPEHEANIISSKRIAVPGCHAGGFIALVKPLIDSGMLSAEAKLTCHSLTGYSGGGKKMIADYENAERSPLLDAPRLYALSCRHKHLREMKAVTGLKSNPIFTPIVADFYSGMLVTVPLFSCGDLQAQHIKELYAKRYCHGMVKYVEGRDEDGFLSAAGLSGSDCMEISVFGNEDEILLCARYDNLGKGASGAAIRCMNIKLGSQLDEGLVL